VQSLAAAIMLFPDEGQYVPDLLDKLESLCKGNRKMEERLVQFYRQFLPKIPQGCDSKPNKYCMAMYKRGIKWFEWAGLNQLAVAYQVRLKLMEEGKPENKKLGRPIRAVLGE